MALLIDVYFAFIGSPSVRDVCGRSIARYFYPRDQALAGKELPALP
jgi:hypothetical protein